ncbi:methionine--tRNA ligase [Candidatus Roizmanbacteria bacterium]|nr:methionine--tRNA ligase [Candidatus Roizmanbacteria bacterium]
MKKILICTSIPYVNGRPHIGHALEYTQADTLARFYRGKQYDVFFTAGSDENAIKNVESAEKAAIPVHEFIDQQTKAFQQLKDVYHITYDDFIRTSSPLHIKGSQKLWNLCSHDIYKKSYEGLYCTGCEAFYKDGEFPDNICPAHNRKLEVIIEENYFFALSKYQQQIHDLIEQDKIRIVPEFRKQEVLRFIDEGLEDFSISRPEKRTKGWGIPVPGDAEQRMYVWFDALTNYISILHFDTNDALFENYWLNNQNKVHIIGKDIVRFHAIYWVGMLLSANLPPPSQLFVHGFITVDGKKMSKTIGNVVDPFDLVTTYGVDAVRYYLLREIPSLDDGDYSNNRMEQLYSTDLANELGNLVLRLTTLAEKDELHIDTETNVYTDEVLDQQIMSYQFNLALEHIWLSIKALNKEVDEFAPWKKQPVERAEFLTNALQKLSVIALKLKPFIPTTAYIISQAVTGKIEKIAPLFPRIQK